MAALKYDLIVDQGATYILYIPVFDDNGDPAYVEGWAATGQIRADYNSTTVRHTLALTPIENSIVLTIPAADSTAWTWQLGRYDVELVAPSTTVTRLIEGWVVVRPNVTR